MDINSLIKKGFNTRQSIEDYVNNVVNQYIVKPSSGQNTGIGGFVFNILDKESVLLTATITDHYVEDNYSAQDHIALAPEKFTLRGYVGEIADIIPSAALSVLTKIQSLAGISDFMNDFSVQATQAYTKIAEVYSKVSGVFSQAQNIYDIFTNNNTSNTKQQKAFAYFYSLWSSRILVDVETPYNVFKNMAIENIEATQNGDTKFISDFSVTFKQIRIATTKTVTSSKEAKGKYSLTAAFNSSQNSLISSLTGKDRAAAMLASVSSGGSTAGSGFNFTGQAVSTDLLAN
jgi:hypothetical protein